MSWNYSNYILETVAQDRYDLLVQHVQEVSDRLSGSFSTASDGFSSSSYNLQEYLNRLMDELTSLETALGLSSNRKKTFTSERVRF